MRIERGLKIALDTNILLDATDEGRTWHAKALSTFKELPLQGADLYLATQVVREYLVVATRPVENNGLGLSVKDAVGNVGQFQKRASLIPETTKASDLMVQWALKFGSAGKKLHDLQLLATVRQAGLHMLLTSNPGDFPRGTEILICSLPELEME